ncbi:MAG: S16 family serine protease [Microthrixaceae bacterium]
MTDNTLPTDGASSRVNRSVDAGVEPTVASLLDSLDPEIATGSEDGLKKTPRPKSRWVALFIFGVIASGLVAAIFLIRLPYYLIQPGSVRPAEQRIDISGAESFENKGDILFTTVFVDQATPALMVRAWLDDSVEIRTREQMYPDGNQKESQEQNQLRMDLSKLTAARVALQYLGIEANYDADGTRVLAVQSDAPAAGVLLPGDVIIAVDGAEIALPSDIAPELADHVPGDQVQVVVRRRTAEGKEVREELEVELGAATEDVVRPILGIEAEPDAPSIESDVQVEVDSGTVSGPSAGLAWTLAILDRLTPGSITQGRTVAVTGEILDDGSVGPIGGILQKVAAVKRAGIKLFIYPAATPADEQKKMRALADGQVELRPVKNLTQAVEALSPQGIQLPR